MHTIPKLITLTLLPLILGGCFVIKSLNESLLFHPQKLPANYKYEFPQPFEERSVAVEGNVKLNALHFKVPDPKAVILYFHGNAGSLASWGNVASDFLPLGYDVFIYDYRGFGKSEGKINSEEQMYADAQVLFDLMAKEYGADRVVLYGRSVGTGVAVHLASVNSARKLVLETPFTSLVALAKKHYPIFPKSFVRYQFSNIEKLSKLSMPVFLIHGTQDRIVPYSESVALMEAKSGMKLFTIDGGGHNDLSAYPAFDQALRDIFN